MASVCCMHKTTAGKYVFMEVQKTLQDDNLRWNHCLCVRDDGETMAGVRKAQVGRISTKL